MTSTAVHFLYSVQLHDRRFGDEGYCGCYVEPVAAADEERVQAELHAANATLTSDEKGRTVRAFWTDAAEAEAAAERAEQSLPGVVAEVDCHREEVAA